MANGGETRLLEPGMRWVVICVPRTRASNRTFTRFAVQRLEFDSNIGAGLFVLPFGPIILALVGRVIFRTVSLLS